MTEGERCQYIEKELNQLLQVPIESVPAETRFIAFAPNWSF